MTKKLDYAINKLLNASQAILDNTSKPDYTEHSLIKTDFLFRLEQAVIVLRDRLENE